MSTSEAIVELLLFALPALLLFLIHSPTAKSQADVCAALRRHSRSQREDS
jgi:hypothetical protein